MFYQIKKMRVLPMIEFLFPAPCFAPLIFEYRSTHHDIPYSLKSASTAIQYRATLFRLRAPHEFFSSTHDVVVTLHPHLLPRIVLPHQSARDQKSLVLRLFQRLLQKSSFFYLNTLMRVCLNHVAYPCYSIHTILTMYPAFLLRSSHPVFLILCNHILNFAR